MGLFQKKMKDPRGRANGGWMRSFLVFLGPPLALVCSACGAGAGSGSHTNPAPNVNLSNTNPAPNVNLSNTNPAPNVNREMSCLKNAGTNANQVSQCAKRYGARGRASCAGYSAAAIGSASFEIDGGTYASVAIAGACPNAFSISRHPELSYSGVPGCQGRYFYDDSNYIRFRYSSRDAYMLWNDTVYHFVSGPRQSGGALVFDQSFSQHHIVVRVGCPPPPPSGPLLPPSY